MNATAPAVTFYLDRDPFAGIVIRPNSSITGAWDDVPLTDAQIGSRLRAMSDRELADMMREIARRLCGVAS